MKYFLLGLCTGMATVTNQNVFMMYLFLKHNFAKIFVLNSFWILILFFFFFDVWIISSIRNYWWMEKVYLSAMIHNLLSTALELFERAKPQSRSCTKIQSHIAVGTKVHSTWTQIHLYFFYSKYKSHCRIPPKNGLLCWNLSILKADKKVLVIKTSVFPVLRMFNKILPWECWVLTFYLFQWLWSNILRHFIFSHS